MLCFFPGFDFDFLSTGLLAKILVGNSVSDITYLVLSGTLNLLSVKLKFTMGYHSGAWLS